MIGSLIACGEGSGDSEARQIAAADEDDDDTSDDDFIPTDDDTGDDDDADDDDTLPDCEFTTCDDEIDFEALALDMWREGQTACGDLNADSSAFAMLAIDDWIASRGDRTVQVEQVDETQTDGVTIRNVRFLDERLGPFSAVVLEPPDDAGDDLPAILLSHGHGSHPGEAIEYHGGMIAARSGYVVVALLNPELGLLIRDDKQAADTYQHWHIERLPSEVGDFGRTAYGTMVYREILALDYIATLPRVDGTRVATWGHSGGSLLARNMLSLDDRVKATVSDFEGDMPEAEEGFGEDIPWEEKIQRFFCWGGGQRLVEMTGGKPIHTAGYGYPAGHVEAALAALEEDFAADTVCDNDICEGGETFAQCPDDCRNPGTPSSFASAASPIPYEPTDSEAQTIDLLTAVQAQYPGAPDGDRNAILKRMGRILGLDGLEARLPCTPQPWPESRRGAKASTRETTYCLGDFGTVETRLSRSEVSTPRDALVVLLGNDPNQPMFVDRNELEDALLAAGFDVLRFDLPHSDHTQSYSNLALQLGAYGFYDRGVYQLMVDRVVRAVLADLAPAAPRLYTVGLEGLGATAMTWAITTRKVKALAAQHPDALWDPNDLDADAEEFHPATHAFALADLGGLVPLLDAYGDRPFLEIDRGVTTADQIVQFLESADDDIGKR
ncbi:MAG: acetylxylan esterase [Deltaproteobacteria bacterium]|nr:acetylxylan esterase [Deltaproteobacteria bacterium]